MSVHGVWLKPVCCSPLAGLDDVESLAKRVARVQDVRVIAHRSATSMEKRLKEFATMNWKPILQVAGETAFLVLRALS